jgi:hypothetical protein
VAEKLLTSSRQVAKLSSSEEPIATPSRFASLKGGFVFWAALARVVIALFVVVAKLVPKPPAA